MKMKSLVFLLLTIACCASILATAQTGATRDLQLRTLNLNGQIREYFLYIPASLPNTADAPVLFFLHGGGNKDGDEIEERLNLRSLAERERFILIYPSGVESQWNDGRGIPFRGADYSEADDVGFISALIDEIIGNYRADSSRVFVMGASNGGMMTLRLACEVPGKITAVAAIIANIPENIYGTCRPAVPIPVLIMNGTDDPMVPYSGGDVMVFGKPHGRVVSTDQTVDFWVRHNGCKRKPVITRLPNRNRRDRSTVTTYQYTDGRAGSEVLLYKIKGGGHTVPGTGSPLGRKLVGNLNQDINGPQEIWEFFERNSNR